MRFHFALWGVFGHFSDIFGIRWDFLGTPAIYFADFGAILAIFDHFWTILGPIFFISFFAENWHFGPETRTAGQNHRRGKSV